MTKVEYLRQWRNANKERCRGYHKKYYQANRKANLEYSRNYSITHKFERSVRNRFYRSTMSGKIKGWKSEAKRKGVEWKLSREYLEQFPLVCAYTGIPLTMDVGKHNTVSLDRIEGEKGYIPGNVVFCTKIINVMKYNQSTEEFIEMCRKIIKYYETIQR